MNHKIHNRRVHLADLSLSLTGVSAGVARRVAATLPAAIAAEIAAPHATATGPLRQSDGSAEAVTARLAREIAGRIRSRIDAREGER